MMLFPPGQTRRDPARSVAAGRSPGNPVLALWLGAGLLAVLVAIAGRAAAQEPDFTIAVLPDTQFYSCGAPCVSNPAIYDSQTQWIVDNRVARNIVYVAHLGDCVENGDNGGDDTEWQNAAGAIGLIEDPVTTTLTDGIPFGIAVGNHDQSPIGSPTGTTTFFNSFFGVSHFTGRGYYGGNFGVNNDNHFDLFSAGSLDFVVVYLEYDALADPAPIAWANGVLQAYPNRRAIVVSHYVMNVGNPGSFGTQGQATYDALKGNPNLFLMLGGHIHGEGRRIDIFNNNTVRSVLSNYQGRTNGGDGWMRIMTFSPANQEIQVETYSPWLDQFETDADSQFTLAYDLTPPCSTNPDCDDGLSCTTDVCNAGVCENTDTCPMGQACDPGTSTCAVPPPFHAYNDLAWGPGQLQTNITRMTSPNGGSGLPFTGELLDYATGVPTGVTLTVGGGEYDGTGQSIHGANAPVGSDGNDEFAGKVHTVGTLSYINQAGENLTLSFTGMDPGRNYNLVYYADRGDYAWDRGSLATLSGADAFTNTSSAGVDDFANPLFSGPTDDSTRLPADNPSGYVAAFSNINPGADGTVLLTVSWDGSDPQSAYKGKYGSAISLQELSPCSVDPDCNDANDCTDDVCNAGTCQYTNNTDPCDDGISCTSDVCTSGVCVGTDTCPGMEVCDEGLDMCVEPPLFTAYNDFAFAAGQLSTNITMFTSPNGGSGLPFSGPLIDYATGIPTAVTLTVTGGEYTGGSQSTHGGEPFTGTDAFDAFDGIVSVTGALSYVDSVSSPLVLTLTGMDPTRVYDVTFTAHRNSYAWDRASLVTISDADAFDNQSSVALDDNSNPLFSGSTDPSTRLPSDNDGGYVATFNSIQPGSDGDVVLTVSWDGSSPASQYKGKYASALRVAERAVCVLGSDCDDLNPCTDDVCTSGVCSNPNNTATCDDGDACTDGDVCSGGACVPGGPLVCDDTNTCTDDSCDAGTGCVFTNNTDPCSDGDACTGGDVCSGGVCVPGGPLVCDDTNVCTDDSCDSGTGCVFTNNTDPCDDGDACTDGDTCSGGACAPGGPLDCDDGSVCTDDSCDSVLGCQYAPANNLGGCDDGDACTQVDLCANGECIGGDPPDCGDGDPCTADSCDSITGCHHDPIVGCTPVVIPSSSSLGKLLLASLFLASGLAFLGFRSGGRR